jgi:hypothetical protein
MVKKIAIRPLDECGCNDWKATGFLDLIVKALNEIPVEHRADATVSLDAADDTPRLIMWYIRAETAEEVAKREAEET